MRSGAWIVTVPTALRLESSLASDEDEHQVVLLHISLVIVAFHRDVGEPRLRKKEQDFISEEGPFSQSVHLLLHNLAVPPQGRADLPCPDLLERVQVEPARTELDLIPVRCSLAHAGVGPSLGQRTPMLWQPAIPAISFLVRKVDVESEGATGR